MQEQKKMTYYRQKFLGKLHNETPSKKKCDFLITMCKKWFSFLRGRFCTLFTLSCTLFTNYYFYADCLQRKKKTLGKPSIFFLESFTRI